MKRKILLITLALTVGLLGGCQEVVEEVQPENVIVEVTNPKRDSLVIQSEFIGTINPQEAVYVVPLVAGEVIELNAQLGAEVKEGQVLCRINDDAAKLQLESAQASLNTAQASANQALGGGMEIQEIQTQSGVKQLEHQVQSTEKTIYESNEKIDELKKQEGDANKAVEDAQNAYKDASARYAIASKLLTEKDAIPALSGKSATQAAAEIVIKSGAGTSLSSNAVQKYLTEHTADADYANNAPALKFYLTMLASGYTDAEISVSGISSLNSAVNAAQSAYQGASSAVSSIKQGISTYESTKKQTETGLQSLYDNLNSTKDAAEVSTGQVKEEAKQVVDAQLSAAGIGVKSAEMQLDMYTITAPISGIIETVHVSENGFASSGQPAFMISNKDSMQAVFHVSEEVRNSLEIGQKVEVDRNENIFQGIVTEIASMVDQQTGLFQVKATVDTKDQTLLTGTTVKIKTDTYRQDEGFLIPYDAVYYDNGEAYVYVIEEGKAVKTFVEQGLFDDTTMAILGGIQLSSQLITSWSPNLRDGVCVSVKGEANESN